MYAICILGMLTLNTFVSYIHNSVRKNQFLSIFTGPKNEINEKYTRYAHYISNKAIFINNSIYNGLRWPSVVEHI